MRMQRSPLVRTIMDDLRRIVHALRTSHRAAEDVHLTGAQLFVLTVLSEAEEAVSIGDVAHEAQTDPSTASVVVKRLADRGYIKRQRATADSRRLDLSLTARGRAVLHKLPVTAPQKKLAEALQRLRHSDAKALARLLDRLVSDMGIAAEPAPMMFADEPRRRRRR